MDYSPPGSSVHGISQARIQKWVAISFSRGIFLTQGSNLSPAMQVDYVPLGHQGNPFGLSEWALNAITYTLVRDRQQEFQQTPEEQKIK